MSWSFSAIGSPENVVAALEAQSEKISKSPDDCSRREFDAAKPHLIALVKQNFADPSAGYSKIAVALEASGSASLQKTSSDPDSEWKTVNSSCLVKIGIVYGWVGSRKFSVVPCEITWRMP